MLILISSRLGCLAFLALSLVLGLILVRLDARA